MARMAVRRALRQCPGLHRRSAYILGVELPNDIDTKLYEEALEHEFQSMDPDGPGRRACPEFHYFIDERGKSSYRRKAPFEAFSVGKKLTEHQRLIGIGTPKHPMSDVFRTIAEAVIEVRPERRHLQAASLIARGFHLSDHIANDLIAHNISNLSIAFRGNRPLKAVLSMLEALAAAEASITPKGRDDEETPPLEEMSGYGEAKEWGLELARDLKDWSAGALAWSDVDRGVLLLGGPGTGKTVFAKALARSCGATFVECSLSKTQALGHLGDMLKGINKAFSEARNNTPAILFLDEFDGVGNRETLSRHAPEYATQVITGLLELMDGSEKRDGVVIIAACNRLETIDRAFLRPGRLERVIEIRPPDYAARKAIFSQHLMSALPEDDLNEIGRLTEGWTGAELERLARDCRRAARRTGKALNAQQVESTISNTFTKVSPRELERFAVHEAGHVVAAYVISDVVATEAVIREYGKTTNGYRIESGGQTTLPVAQASFQVRSDYLDKIAVLLAGHAAEELFFDEASDGAGLVAGSDLEQATMVAARLVASSGLAKNLVFRAERTDTDLRRILREDPKFTRACDTILRAQSQRAHHVLGQHESILRAISAELGRRKSLARKEIKRLLTLKMDQKSD
ncbi:AAA family ATPase [Roseibium suaedae]|uniref:ATP-dependent Zn proteases n=1 Tax=Roseibium suaedae TaxID=735517 RepID=A0A1M7L6R3_9HYPH|nr:AAA family ATPase [Roseibium suaedae]SHM73544.1 ATP-dependent Zn proteases [Roseibium suaedae]